MLSEISSHRKTNPVVCVVPHTRAHTHTHTHTRTVDQLGVLCGFCAAPMRETFDAGQTESSHSTFQNRSRYSGSVLSQKCSATVSVPTETPAGVPAGAGLSLQGSLGDSVPH